MSRKGSTIVKVLVIVLLATLIGSQAWPQSSRPVSDGAHENLLKTIYESTWFVPNPDYSAIEEAEMARAYQREPSQARENLLKTIHASAWFIPKPEFAAIEDAEMARAYQLDLDKVAQTDDL